LKSTSKPEPLVSIIIPCYNSENTIKKTVESVLSQTYDKFECIIIDDGSADNSKREISKTLEDKRIKYYHQSNKGLSVTRNRGVDLSKGDYIYFLDSDDLIDSRALDNLLSFLNSDDIDIVVGKTAKTIGQNFEIDSYMDHKMKTNLIIDNSNKSLLTEVTINPVTGLAQNKLYSKSFITKNQIKFKEGIYHEDELWNFQTLFNCNNIVYSDKVTYYYNVESEGSIMSTYTFKHLKNYIAIIEYFYSQYLKSGNSEQSIHIANYMTRIKLVIAMYWQYQFKKGFRFKIAKRKIRKMLKRTQIKNYSFENLPKKLRNDYIKLNETFVHPNFN